MRDAISWEYFTRRLANKIERPRFAGTFTEEEAKKKNMRLATGRAVHTSGARVQLYLLVDPWDGVIADACFSAYGPPICLGLAEAACELVMRKNYDQARHINAELLDKQVRDKQQQEGLPKETFFAFNLVIEAIESAAEKCTDIPLSEEYVPSPMQKIEDGKPYPGWEELSNKQQITVIEEVIAVDIRPYIELDAGGIEIIRLEGKNLEIAYKGACTTCPSAVGSTLEAIQSILSAKVHPEIKVIPDMSFLQGPS